MEGAALMRGAEEGGIARPWPPPPPQAGELGALHPRLWPRSAVRSDGALTIAGVDVREIAATYGTPAFILDEADFRSRCRDFRSAFAPTADVFYASEAFLCIQVARWIEAEGLGLDVCTGGELATALRAGFPSEQITFHGHNKSVVELEAAVTAGVGRVVVESNREITRLADISARRGRCTKVMIRAAVGVEAHTHEYVATAHDDQQFGFSTESGAALEAVRRVLRRSSLDLVGVHSHIGSQILEMAGFGMAARRVIELLGSVRDEHGLELVEVCLGGGFGIAYTPLDVPPGPAQIAESLRAIIGRECAAAGLSVPRLSVEPGRAIAGPGTVTLYEVGTVKHIEGVRSYVSVDGGMRDNLRPAPYGAEHACVLASRAGDDPPVLARVVGKHCEADDALVSDVWLPADIAPGDLLAVAGTGAYCRAMASNYHMVGRPPVISVSNCDSREILRRETLEDLLRTDVG